MLRVCPVTAFLLLGPTSLLAPPFSPSLAASTPRDVEHKRVVCAEPGQAGSWGDM